jgi:hypothetical protein
MPIFSMYLLDLGSDISYSYDMINTKTSNQETLSKRFYNPLDVALDRAGSTRKCQEYSDQCHLHSGVGRVVGGSKTGREWVQLFSALFAISLSVSNFFAALRSQRRLRLLQEVDKDVRDQANDQIFKQDDPFQQYPELAQFEIYASDGHSQKASAHEDLTFGKKRAVNHLFSLSLRTHTATQLTVTQPAVDKKKEHEIKALKRIGGAALRLGAPKGTKVIHAYDPAIIDYDQWYRWKKGHGVYIVTLEKSNSALFKIGLEEWDKQAPCNIGVLSNEMVISSKGATLRRVRYRDPVTGEVYSFITNEMTLPPGFIAFIYKLRWDIEKVFDEFKNKLEQKKAWGKHNESKTQQAHFITLAHNLMLMLESTLKNEEDIVDTKVQIKRARRLAEDIQKAMEAGRTPNILVQNLTRATQRSLQFIRWLRTGLIIDTSWKQAVIQLRPLMMKYLS